MANLEQADLRRAKLEGTIFRDATLWLADLRGARMEGVELEGAALDGSTLGAPERPLSVVAAMNVTTDIHHVGRAGFDNLIFPRLDEACEVVLEAALRLTEASGRTHQRVPMGRSVAVCVCEPEHFEWLHFAWGTAGIDKSVLIEATQGAVDANAVARAIEVVALEENADLVLLGLETEEFGTGAVAGALADHLGWPLAARAVQIIATPGAPNVLVTSQGEHGLVRQRVTLPAVISVADQAWRPNAVLNSGPDREHHPNGRTLARSLGELRRTMPTARSLIDLGIDERPRSTYTRYEFAPARSGTTEFVSDVDGLVQRLRQQGLI